MPRRHMFVCVYCCCIFYVVGNLFKKKRKSDRPMIRRKWSVPSSIVHFTIQLNNQINERNERLEMEHSTRVTVCLIKLAISTYGKGIYAH